MKKLFGIISICILTVGLAVAQDNGKAADSKNQTTAAKVTNNCDMNNFCCMRAGRMTRIENGQEVGMPADYKLKSGATVKTNGTLINAKGKTTATLKEGEAIDMNGNICVMGAKPAVPPADVK
jgi:hypothetical protein